MYAKLRSYEHKHMDLKIRGLTENFDLLGFTVAPIQIWIARGPRWRRHCSRPEPRLPAMVLGGAASSGLGGEDGGGRRGRRSRPRGGEATR